MFSLKATPCSGLLFPLAQDVEFVMAADSGISASDWASEKDFVQDALENLLAPSGTRVGIVDFSTTSQVRLTSRLLSTLSQTMIESTITSLPFTQGQAATLRSNLASDNIDVLEVMIGANQHSGTLGCLVHNDQSKIVQITGAEAALSAALAPDTPVSSAPEPGTFGFAFGALGFVGLAARRRAAKHNEA